MKSRKMLTILVVSLGLMVWPVEVSEAAPMGTAFTYQGRLMNANAPAEGLYDFQFKLYDDANTITGNQQGSTIDINDLEVIDGYFTVELDFNSPSAFNGYARWLEIAIRPGESNDPNDFGTLSPRQELTPTPYAIYAETAGTDNDWMLSGDDMYSIPAGNVGIGTSTPESRLHIEQSVGAWDEGIRLSYGDHAWDIITDFGGERLTIAPDQDSTEGLVMRNGNVGIGTTSPSKKLTVRGNILLENPTTGAAVVELGEGLDYSEGFDVTEKAGVTPGTVLVIDAENPGKLTVSSSPYDCKVAGIVAGGEGLGSGVRLGVSQFDQDVALAGRVYCKVDATERGVEPGDLLTTSGTPGYAMKATDYMRAQGAILGKAMEKIQQGNKGHILVLVTLQ